MFLMVHQQTVEKEDNREIQRKCSVLLPIWEGNEIIEQKKTIEKGFIGVVGIVAGFHFINQGYRRLPEVDGGGEGGGEGENAVNTTGVTTVGDFEHHRLRLDPPTALTNLSCSFSDNHWNNRAVTEPPFGTPPETTSDL
ncbi:unnamed protein product [Lactuca virosa]|uniref:Uncharacterized protein n=1 Tax=Lactuca virosa TaxID=75947 RepID=A0AAU9N5S4_9ASTR|nr:unnamed protein product [Lactuca virosa]